MLNIFVKNHYEPLTFLQAVWRHSAASHLFPLGWVWLPLQPDPGGDLYSEPEQDYRWVFDGWIQTRNLSNSRAMVLGVIKKKLSNWWSIESPQSSPFLRPRSRWKQNWCPLLLCRCHSLHPHGGQRWSALRQQETNRFAEDVLRFSYMHIHHNNMWRHGWSKILPKLHPRGGSIFKTKSPCVKDTSSAVMISELYSIECTLRSKLHTLS